MSANVEGLLREGMNAIKAGRKDEGKALLLKAVELDQYNSEAWLWLSGTMESLDDQRTCLENVLAIDPNNERAKQGVEYLSKQTSKPASAFSPSSPTPLVSRAATTTSVEWGAPEPTSAAPMPTWAQAPTAKEPTEEDLDAWVSTLNLPTAAPVKPSPSGTSTTSPFTDFNLEDDLLAGGPFGAPAQVEPPKSSATRQQTPSPRSPVPSKLSSFGFDDDADPLSKKGAKQGGSILYDADQDEDGKFLEEEEGSLFGDIPGEIRSTRMPGTRERAPLHLVAVTVVLVIVNVGVATLLAIGLLSAS